MLYFSEVWEYFKIRLMEISKNAEGNSYRLTRQREKHIFKRIA